MDRPFRVLDRLLALGAFAALVLAPLLCFRPAKAASPLMRSEANACVFTVSPSSGVAVQFNSTSTLGGSAWNPCTSYNEVCWQNMTTTSGNTVYISTFNTTNTDFGWGAIQYHEECKDWTQTIPLWFFYPNGQTGESKTLKFLLSR